MTEAEKAYQYFVIAVPENEEQAKAYFWARKALQSTLTQPPITGDTSDGYHTFNELYHHRAVLFSVICNEHHDIVWKSKKHHDGTMYDGMFIVGIDTPEGQATYHYDIDPYWNLFRVKELELAPEWDGHTPGEAIRRIGTLTHSNGPLTWNELAEMEDQPVYIVEMGARRYWALVTHVGKDVADFVTVHDPDDYGDKELYGESWVAYRRPKEEEGKPTEPPNV